MVIYVSAATKAQGGIYADPKYVIDPSISTDYSISPLGKTITVTAVAPTVQAAAPQPSQYQFTVANQVPYTPAPYKPVDLTPTQAQAMGLAPAQQTNQSLYDIQVATAEKMKLPVPTVQENWNKDYLGTGKTLAQQYNDFAVAQGSPTVGNIVSPSWMSNEDIVKLAPEKQVDYFKSIGLEAALKEDTSVVQSGDQIITTKTKTPVITGIFDPSIYNATNPDIQAELKKYQAEGFSNIDVNTTFDAATGTFKTTYTPHYAKTADEIRLEQPFIAPTAFVTAKWLSDADVLQLNPVQQVDYLRSIGVNATLATEIKKTDQGETKVETPIIAGIANPFMYNAANPQIQGKIKELQAQGFYGVQANTAYNPETKQFDTTFTTMGKDAGALVPMESSLNLAALKDNPFVKALFPISKFAPDEVKLTSYYSSKPDTTAAQIIGNLRAEEQAKMKETVWKSGDILGRIGFTLQNEVPILSDVLSPYKVTGSMQNLGNVAMQAANTQAFGASAVGSEGAQFVPLVVKSDGKYSTYKIPTEKTWAVNLPFLGNVANLQVGTQFGETTASYIGSPAGTALEYAGYAKGFQVVTPWLAGIGGKFVQGGGALIGKKVAPKMASEIAGDWIGKGILGTFAATSGIEAGTIRNPRTGEAEGTDWLMGVTGAVGTLGAFRTYENVDYSLQAKEPFGRLVQSPLPFKVSKTPLKYPTGKGSRTVASDVWSLSYEGFPFGGYGEGTSAKMLVSATTGVGRLGRKTKFGFGDDIYLPKNLGKVRATWSTEGLIQNTPTTTTIREFGIKKDVVSPEEKDFYFTTKKLAQKSEKYSYRLTDYDSGSMKKTLKAREEALMGETFSQGTVNAQINFLKSQPDIVVQGGTAAATMRTPEGKPFIDRYAKNPMKGDIDATLSPGIITTMTTAGKFRKPYSAKSEQFAKAMNKPEDNVVFFRPNEFQIERMRLGEPKTMKAADEALFEPRKFAELLTPESGAEPAEIQNFGIRRVRTTKSQEGIKMSTPGQEVIQSGSRLFHFGKEGFAPDKAKASQIVGDFYIKALRTASTIRNEKVREQYIEDIKASYGKAPKAYKQHLETYAKEYYAPEFELLGIKAAGKKPAQEIKVRPQKSVSISNPSLFGISSLSSILSKSSLSSKSLATSLPGSSASKSSRSSAMSSLLSSVSKSLSISSPSSKSSQSSRSSRSSSSVSSSRSSSSKSSSKSSSGSSSSSSSSSSVSMPRISTPSGFGGGSPFGFGEGGGAKGKTSSPRKRYTPDLTAGVFQIIRRGKAPAENLGFGVEAIYVENMPKSRRSNIKMPRVKPFKMPNLLGGRRK